MNQDLNGSPAHETGNKELAALEPHEFALPHDSDEFLWRQITPIIWYGEEGQPKTDAFGPKLLMSKNLLFSRNALVTAKEAFEWHNKHAKSQSLEVWLSKKRNETNDQNCSWQRLTTDNSTHRFRLGVGAGFKANPTQKAQ